MSVEESLKIKRDTDARLGVGTCFRCAAAGTVRCGETWACDEHESELQKIVNELTDKPKIPLASKTGRHADVEQEI